MPELPDVEHYRRVAERAIGYEIDHVDVRDAGALEDVSPQRFGAALAGRCFGSPRRHGKWLIMPVRTVGRRHTRNDSNVILHFGMTGELIWAGRAGTDEPVHRHDRILIATEQGELRYRDMRKLKGLRLAVDDGEVSELLATNGPDAAEVTASQVGARLKRTGRQVKTALMDQAVLAGIGNLLADEILWRARIHPRRSSADLSDSEIRRIHRRMRTVLRHSMADGSMPTRAGWLTGRRDREGAACPRCGTQLRDSRVGSRRSVWCPHCQPSPD